jgi:TolB protein
MRKSFIVIVVLMLTLVSFEYGQAQGFEIWDEIESSEFKPIRLAINQVHIRGEVSPEDSALAKKIYSVLNDDLDFHFIIDTVMLDPFILKVYEAEEPDLMIWKQLGADHVLNITAEFSDDKIRLDYSLQNIRILKESSSDSYRLERQYWRTLAHTVSDEVVERLTGYKGIFSTRLVFVTAKTGNKEIYVSDYDGYNVQAVTKNGSINISPIWDSRSESILYTSYKKGQPDIWEADLKNGEHNQIASYPGINSAPAISPNNKEMVLTLSKDGNAELYLTNRKGKIKRRLTNSFAIETSPSFSPSGRELAFTSDRTGGPQIYMMDTEGLNVRRITYIGAQNESPSISPDGSKIAYVTRSGRGSFDICVADINGSNYKIITNSGFNENPRWAPDGLHVIYSSQFGDRSVLYISDYLGLKKRLVCNQPGSSNPCWSGFLQ